MATMLILIGLLLTIFITLPSLILFIVFKRIDKSMDRRGVVESPMLDAAIYSMRRRGDDHEDTVQHRQRP